MPRSFWFYISFGQCFFQVCMASMIVYYWHITSTNDEEQYNPYLILCSVVPRKYRELAHVLLVCFYTFVFYVFMEHFYDFCLDPKNDSYANFQERKEEFKKKKKQKLIRRCPQHKKPKPYVRIEDPTKDWRPPLNGDYIIRENIEDLYRKKCNEYLRETSSSHKYTTRMKSAKRQ